MQAFYRYPGPHEIGNYGKGVGFECACLPASETDRMVSEGWSLTPDDALAAHKHAAPTEPDEPTAPEAVAEVTEPAQNQPKRRGRPPKVRDDQEKISG